MEWVEFTAKSIDEATEAAAQQLGLEVTALDIEVIDEPVVGLFGRTRGDARIRARAAGKKAGKVTKKTSKTVAAPTAAQEGSASARSTAMRPKASQSALAVAASVATAPAPRATRPPRDNSSRGSGTSRPPRPPRVNDEPIDVDAVVSSSNKFLKGLLKAADLEGKLSHRVVDEQTVEIAIAGDGLGMFIGPKGQTLLAVQELLRTFVHHDTGGRSGRLMLDVASYREKRRVALVAFTKQVAESVIETGERRVLEPMSAVDRKVIHDTAGELSGVSSISEGEDPYRYVVLLPE
jgi:spoIIIJ-associated protein